MKKSKRFAPVLNIAVQKEEVAAKELAKLHQLISAEKQKLQILENYQKEYIQGIRDLSFEKMPVSKLVNRKEFTENIEVSIRSQTGRINQLNVQFEKMKKAWEKCHQYAKSLDEYVENCRFDEFRFQEKQEQKSIEDMLNSRRYYDRD